MKELNLKRLFIYKVICLNVYFCFGQLHYEAWVRFVILGIITVGVYAFYGQHHADPSSEETIVYHRAPREDA